MSPQVRRSFVLVAALAAVVSCSGGDSDEAGGSDSLPETSPATTWAPPESSEPVPTSVAVAPTTEPSADTLPVETTTVATTDVPADDRGECLVGEWVLTDEQMNVFYEGVMTTVDAPITLVATGQAGLTFGADGTYSWAPDFDLAVDIVGATGTGSTTGAITGSWTAADGMLTTASDVNAIDLTITVNGTTFSGSDLANGLLNSSPINGVTYSCAGPTPVLDFKTADPGVTVPVTLTPA